MMENTFKNNNYFVLKTIFDGLNLKLLGQELETFVVNSTGCTPEEFYDCYDEVILAWTK